MTNVFEFANRRPTRTMDGLIEREPYVNHTLFYPALEGYECVCEERYCGKRVTDTANCIDVEKFMATGLNG